MSLTLEQVAAESPRLQAVAKASSEGGLRIGPLRGVGSYSLVFDLDSPVHGASVLKIPNVRSTECDEHPDMVSRGHGPNLIRLVSPTGPFVLEAPKTYEAAAGLLTSSWQQQRDRGMGRPLARLHEVISLAGVPCAVLERIEGESLATMSIRDRDQALRRLVSGVAQPLGILHGQFGAHGDLKPEHLIFDRDGQLVFIDPVVDTAAVGSIGYSFALQVPRSNPAHQEVAELRDLVAVALMVAELLPVELGLDGRFLYRVVNQGNGRFGRGLELEPYSAWVQETLRKVPEPIGPWLRNIVGMTLEILTCEQEAPPEGWSREQLHRLERMA